MPANAADAKQVFLQAVEQYAPEEWSAFLDSECTADLELRRRVERLLKAHRQANQLLDGAGLLDQREISATPTINQHLTERPGDTIGPYKLLEQIGEGGFGIVFMAEQVHPVKRKVALKVIKPGMDTHQVIARFEAERQALALMDHSNIAKVLDASETESGRPYFVMELVKGVPITDYCDQHQLPTSERLELFVTVCQAVQHAHQKGIIHRDIKPTNVLVAPHDDRPVVKVIDFGIAKATSGQLTDKTLFTGYAQLIGTPLYMSPEQAAMNAVDVDTRSDIYSLGVLLYELLTGTTPFEKTRLQEAAFDEVRRIIREEEPPRPSARISTVRNAETALSAKHQAGWKQHGPTILGELDWIVMKALDKDRNRRYESAGAMARDIERHLRDEPVQACPPSALYRYRKFARRNKSILATAAIVGLAVLLSVVALVTSALHVGRQQDVTAAALRNEMKADEGLALALRRERQHLAEERLDAYFQRIGGAHHALSKDDLGLALSLLEECPPELRGWEWRYLMRLCWVQPVVLSNNTEMNGLAFSPGGERIAGAGGDGTIRIWNSLTGNLDQTIPAHSKSVVAVKFHPNAEYMASVGADRLVKVWDLSTREPIFTRPCDIGRTFGTAYTVAFSHDGRQLAAASEGAVKIWDWKNPQFAPLHTLAKHSFHTIPVGFSGEGRLATCMEENGLLHIWDVETGLRAVPGVLGGFGAIAFSQDGEWLASAGFDRRLRLSNSKTGKLLYDVKANTGNVECVAFSPDGKRLASGGEDKIVRIWDTATGRELLSLRGHTGRSCCVAFSPDGHRLASASKDGTIRFWDATPLEGNERQEILNFTGHSDEIRTLAVSGDGQRVASAGNDAIVRIWDASTGETSVELNRDGHVVFCLAWQPAGDRIVVAGSKNKQQNVTVWDVRTGHEAFPLQSERSAGPYNAVAFSPDGRYVVTGHAMGLVQVWDARTGDNVGTLGAHGGAIRAVVFSADGRHLASTSDGWVKLWDGSRLDKQQDAREFPARVPGPSLNVAFSLDGLRLATGGEKNTVIIRDVETGMELQTLWGEHSGEVYAVAFSPIDDGRLIASAGEDSAVKVWDTQTGKLIRSFRGHTGLVCCLAFSPDGSRLVSGSRDTTAKVWDMTQLSDSKHKP